MSKTRKQHSAQEKTSILRDHLINKAAVSDLCDKHNINPTLYYKWQKIMFENMPILFESKKDAEVSKLRTQNEALREKLAHKDSVISEIMEAYIVIKKNSLGEL
jgi:transposase-like protein